MNEQDIDHLATSGCSTCREIAQRELEFKTSISGRAVGGPNISSDTFNFIQELVEWVTVNSWRESIFLSANPGWNVNAHSLIDHISEKSGISKEKLGEWVEAKAKIVDSKNWDEEDKEGEGDEEDKEGKSN